WAERSSDENHLPPHFSRDSNFIRHLCCFLIDLSQNAKKAGSSELQQNSQAYSPEGYSISLLPALNSRQDAAACPAQGMKIATLSGW
ncbi:hypothetical protein, partial [uncultured Mailhella sp.]|uniref:hypothetical protein n=1 Tax=uncultured Mailhella sp. TaxID=1981031 RepID=UPI0025E78B0A